MPYNAYRDKFIALTENGEKLREELFKLKKRPIHASPSDTRADILKCERLQNLIDENLKELQFTYYLMKADDIK